MIKEFVNKFDENRKQLTAHFTKAHPANYGEIVKAVIAVIGGEDTYSSPDPERIHQIDDGDYQGTLIFVIAAGGYQPNDYWYVKVFYGSCSGCDTLQAIHGYDDNPPTKEQVKSYMTLALHIVQDIKKMGEVEG